jgi:GT2 family glycosyltransferase
VIHEVRPRVVVGIVSWNGRAHLEICLEALTTQEDPGPPWQVVVYDNGSDDGTQEWLRARHPEVRVLAGGRNVGFCRAYNELVGAVGEECEAVALLNNDTRPRPDWLRSLVRGLERAPADVAAISGLILDWEGERLDFASGLVTFDGHAFQRGFRRPLSGARELIPAAGAEVPFACGGNALVRRRSFLAAGGFDDAYFAYFEDVDLGWRLWSGGERVLFEPGAVVHHRSSATSDRLGLFNRGLLFERNALWTAYKNLDEVYWPRLMPAILLTFQSRTQAMLVQNNPDGGLAAVDPYAESVAPAAGGRLRNWLRLPAAAPRLTDPRTLAQFRASQSFLDRLEEAAGKRAAAQARRRRPDREILERFPLHLVPTYPGDAALFANPGFTSWLPAEPRLVRLRLEEVMAG